MLPAIPSEQVLSEWKMSLAPLIALYSEPSPFISTLEMET